MQDTFMGQGTQGGMPCLHWPRDLVGMSVVVFVGLDGNFKHFAISGMYNV